MEYQQFSAVIEHGLHRYAGLNTPPPVDDMIDSLYSMGMFGVVHFLDPGQEASGMYCPPTKESRRHFVDFFYKNPHPAISGTLDATSVVAFHPVFIDYCRLRPHPSLIVG